MRKLLLLLVILGIQALSGDLFADNQVQTGELVCWQFAYDANDNLDSYEATKEVKYLEAAEKSYDSVVARILKDPDGYPGTIGPVTDGPETDPRWADTLIGDSLVAKPLLRFAEIVNADPKLKSRWEAKAQSYIDLSIKMCWEKWNHRDCYYEDASGFGSYHTHQLALEKEDLTKWVPRPELLFSLNLNKHYQAAVVFTRLWRLTGRVEFKKRAIAIFSRAKAMWRYYPEQDRVVWNFWMPHGAYDIEGTAPKSWVAVHPERPGYQAGEVADWVEAYDSGIVFEKIDLERIIRTNLWMAGGDPTVGNVQWKNADGTSNAGCLWTALARFDDKIFKATETQLSAKPSTLPALEYLKNVTEKRLGWNRLYVQDESKVEISRPPLQPGEALTMAIPLPNTLEIANSDRIKLATQTRAAGKLVIDLLSEDGKSELGNLASIDVPGELFYSAPLWDGKNPKTMTKTSGNYLIRWTLNNEVRTWPVVVKVGVLKEKKTATALTPGSTLKVNFEGALDPKICILKSAAVSEEQSHEGKKSLKIDDNQEALIVFGEQDNLPVRISFWIYDGGETRGATAANGACWGVQTAVGDKFVFTQIWRSYLDGDHRYCWINSGENQFFSPHLSVFGRTKGWSQWVLDFSNPSKPLISNASKESPALEPVKFIPASGATSIYLRGGCSPIYVDDIVVEYPMTVSR